MSTTNQSAPADHRTTAEIVAAQLGISTDEVYVLWEKHAGNHRSGLIDEGPRGAGGTRDEDHEK